MNRALSKTAAFVLTLASILLFVFAFSGRTIPENLESQADRLGRRIEQRLEIMKLCVEDSSRRVPDDIVIYRYVDDSLIQWNGRFPVYNDEFLSPLSNISSTLSYCNLGTSWYLINSVREGRTRIVSGVEILSTSFGRSRANPHLELGHRYSINTLSGNDGAEVWVAGCPRFKVYTSYLTSVPFANAVLLWLSLLFFLIGVQLYLYSEVSFRHLAGAIVAIISVISAMYGWGFNVRDAYPVFSPRLFCTGEFFFSLGSVILINLAIANISFSLFLSRNLILSRFSDRRAKILLRVFVGVAIAGILILSQYVMRRIAMDSAISPELYKLNEISVWTVILYASFLGLMFSVPLLLSVLGLPSFSRKSRVAGALLIGAYLVGMAAVFGFRKEMNRSEDWAFRLAEENSGTIHSPYEEYGYAKIIGSTLRKNEFIPDVYSYALYTGDELSFFRGTFPYPVVLNVHFRKTVLDVPGGVAVGGEMVHFSKDVGGGRTVVITRPNFGLFNQFTAFAFVSLVAFLLLGLFGKGKTKEKSYRNFYRTRIHVVLMVSLITTLVAMALASIVFVFRRNQSNIRTVTAETISYIQTMVQRASLNSNPEPSYRMISSTTRSDINIFARNGKMVFSTAPEIAGMNGCRMEEHAFDEIMHKKARYFIQKERIGRRRVYMMYAPVRNPSGEIISIVSSPYAGSRTYDFERDVVMHSMAIITIFIILLMAARFLTTLIVDRMFGPLSALGVRMSGANLESLEKLKYDGEDELTPLVEAYNRMVDELSESSLKLAQAERDKAWSGMARQVAHEIKNPLTPMKLQLQRIMRLKQKGGDEWQEKFDEVVEVLLNHIDILTKTANEFSDFAKLYTEEPAEINLDSVLQEEISMFDSKADLQIEYMGFKDAVVSGPKPQLTRVFINIINNAVQAVQDVSDAKILISLRNSSDSGYYDIVFEDNGPGVSEENISRLFTPNFTTKNGGSGLGLAMSRSILEKCSATIQYSRSFTLGGACFLIKYPKSQTL